MRGTIFFYCKSTSYSYSLRKRKMSRVVPERKINWFQVPGKLSHVGSLNMKAENDGEYNYDVSSTLIAYLNYILSVYLQIA